MTNEVLHDSYTETNSSVVIDNFVIAETARLPIDAITPHPDNRPLGIEQTKINHLADLIAQNGYYGSRPIIVRPMGDGYQIIEGEHRWRACKKLGYKSVLCEVHERDDQEALARLIAGNTQSENCPLDVGAAALKFCEKGINQHSGNESSYTEFAKKTGYSKQSITKYVSAYTILTESGVAISQPHENGGVAIKTKTYQLIEIKQAPASCWFTLVTLLLDKGWTVQETRKAVNRANEFEIPEPWQEIFLSLPVVIYRALDTNEFSPKTVAKLIETVEAIESRISTYKANTDALIAEFRQWLDDHAMFEAWDVRKVIEYGRELQARAEAAERDEQDRYALGDWREHLANLADESVALVLTDPPYGMGYQSDYRLNRDLDRKHATIENDAKSVDATKEICECLTTIHPKLKESAHVFCFCHWSNEADIRAAIEAAGYKVRGSLIWVKNNTGMGDPNTTFAPKHERIIHAVKGSPVLFTRTADVLFADRCDSERHPTEKPLALLKQLIEVTTTKDEIVVDPFAGVASTLVAAKELGRAFFGCEIDEGYHAKGTDRLRPSIVQTCALTGSLARGGKKIFAISRRNTVIATRRCKSGKRIQQPWQSCRHPLERKPLFCRMSRCGLHKRHFMKSSIRTRLKTV